MLEKISIQAGRYKKKGPFESYQKFKKMLPLKILDVNSKGKLIYFTFENNIWMLNTLGLTGGWFYEKNNIIYHPLNNRYITSEKTNAYMKNALNHRNIKFDIGNETIYFYDQLSFGTIRIIDQVEKFNKIINLLGPDIMNLHTTFDIFKENIKKKSTLDKHIGNVLMNQRNVCGIGNYLRADALWMSRISPFRKIKNLTDAEFLKIYNSVRFLIWSEYNYNKGVKLGIIDTKTKTPTYYDRDFFIYDQKTDIYGNKVTKEELFEGSQKRFIYWVPKLQK